MRLTIAVPADHHSQQLFSVLSTIKAIAIVVDNYKSPFKAGPSGGNREN